MIPMLQQDYIRYQQAFKGNYRKGRDLFTELIDAPATAEPLSRSPAAAAAVFTNITDPSNALLPRAMAGSPYAEQMLLTYVNSLMGTEYTTLEAAFSDDRIQSCYYGKDACALPFIAPEAFGSVLQCNSARWGYAKWPVKYHIEDSTEYLKALPMKADVITIDQVSALIWAATYVPGKGWYVAGAYATSDKRYRSARVWQIVDGKTVARYSVPNITSTSNACEYVAMEYHPEQNRIYAFRAPNSSNMYSISATGVSTTLVATMTLDVFTVNANGTLTLYSTSAIGTNVTVMDVSYDPNRGKFVGYGYGNSSFTFGGRSYSHTATSARPFLFYGDSTGWTAIPKASFSKSPGSYLIRRMSIDKATGNWLFTLYANTTLLLKPNNSTAEVIINSGSGNMNFGNNLFSIGRSRWLAPYYSSTSSMPYVLITLTDSGTLQAVKTLSYYGISGFHYMPDLQFLAFLYGSTRGYFKGEAWVVENTLLTAEMLGYRYVWTSPLTEQTLTLAVQSEVSNAQSDSVSNKLKLVHAFD